MNDEFINIESLYNPNPNKHRNFIVNCFRQPIKTTVTSTPSIVRNWVYKIKSIHHSRRHKLVVGVGVQWRPTYRSDTPIRPATLQLCVGGHCLIYQLIYTSSVPRSLRRFLSDPQTTFVRDTALLLRSEHKLYVSSLVDLRYVAAERVGTGKRVSMETLAAVLLGADDVKKPKGIGRSAWDAFWLSEEQVQYACVDAFLSFSMGKELKVWDW